MKTIVLEGLDATFKSTNKELLIKYLEETLELKVFTLHFPTTTTRAGKQIQQYLIDGFGDLTNEQIAKLYAEDRREALSAIDLESYDLLLFDRYTTSTMIYQSTHLDTFTTINFCDKLIEDEYRYIPKPDCIIYLYNPVTKLRREALKRRLTACDVFEADTKYQDKVFNKGEVVSEYYKWNRIRVTDKNKHFRTREEIFDDIKNVINNTVITFR